MAFTEIELKLSLAAVSAERLRAHLQTHPHAQAGGVKRLENTYFDTADGALNRARCAMRIRHVGERYIQTLKTAGSSSAGMHQRQEWEWEVPTSHLDGHLLEEGMLPEGVSVAQLQAVFTTDFERTIFNLTLPTAQLELAIDVGEIRSGERRIALHELELELREGDPLAAFGFAAELAQLAPMRLSSISKGEQGYYVAGVQRYSHAPQSLLRGDTRVIGLLDAWIKAMSRYQLTGEWPFLLQAQAALAELCAAEAGEAAVLAQAEYERLVVLFEQACDGEAPLRRDEVLWGSTMAGELGLAFAQCPRSV